MKSSWLIPAAALVLSLGVGHLLRKISPPTPAPSQSSPTAAQPRTRGYDRNRMPPHPAPGPLAADSTAACRRHGRTGRIIALTELYSTLDSAAAAAEAARLADLPVDERFIGMFLLYGRWAETDPVAALDHLGTLGRTGAPFLPVLLQCWTASNPAAAAAFYQANPDRFAALRDMGGGDAAAHIAGEWARNDPAAALAWAHTLTGMARDAALCNALRETAAADPVRAWTGAAAISPPHRTETLLEIARQHGATDPAGANREIAALTNEPAATTDLLHAAVLVGLSREDPALAAEHLASLPAGTGRDDAIWQVVTANLASQDAAAAARWITGHMAGSNQNDHLTRIMTEFVRQDTAAARTFANSLPPGRTRDWAVCRFALDALIQHKAPFEELTALTESIADPEIHRWARDWLAKEHAKSAR